MKRLIKNLIICTVVLHLPACTKSTLPPTLKEMPGIAKQEYVPGTEDIPLYFGFHAKESDQNISYDSVDGRIINATFYSKTASAENVRKFYDTTLPQLGWSKQQYQVYKRDGEILKINILQKDNKILLKFAIRPDLS